MVVELSVTVFVKGEAIAIGAERLSIARVGEGCVAFGVWLFNLRKQRSALGEGGLVQAGEFAQSWKEIDGFDDRVRLCARILHTGDGR